MQTSPPCFVLRPRELQILVSSRIAEAVEVVARLEDLGDLELKVLRRPVAAFNVTELISGAPACI
jgi:class 3 adenylate cyclase